MGNLKLGCKGTLFLFFVSRLLGPRVCGRQEKKRKKTHWAREGAVLSTNEHERGPHGGLKCIKARSRTEKTLYTLPGRYLAPFS